jgi:hypothetical protein
MKLLKRFIRFFVTALYHRAASHCAKQQYEEAKRDLEHLRTIDPDNNEAQVKFLPTLEELAGKYFIFLS